MSLSPRPTIQCCIARKGCLESLANRLPWPCTWKQQWEAGTGVKQTILVFHAITRKIFKMFQLNLSMIVALTIRLLDCAQHFLFFSSVCAFAVPSQSLVGKLVECSYESSTWRRATCAFSKYWQLWTHQNKREISFRWSLASGSWPCPVHHIKVRLSGALWQTKPTTPSHDNRWPAQIVPRLLTPSLHQEEFSSWSCSIC